MSDNINFYSCGISENFKENNPLTHFYFLNGADLSQKGQCIAVIADVLGEKNAELYFSPFDDNLPCAAFFPRLNAFIGSDCSGIPSNSLNCRYYDIGCVITSNPLPIREVVGYTFSQSNLYAEKSLQFITIADLLLKELRRISREALIRSRLEAYASRKLSSFLSKINKSGYLRYKSISAICPYGYKFADIPQNYKVILLKDELISASVLFVKYASEYAQKLGFDVIISKAVDSPNSPLHLIIPEAKIIFISESKIFPCGLNGEKFNLNRYYEDCSASAAVHHIEFLSEYISKIYSESAVYASISCDIKNQGRKILLPFINDSPIGDIASDIIFDITNNCD
jgi:hypothetical protein